MIEINLAIKNGDPYSYVDVSQYDTASVEAVMLQGSTFDSGVIEIKKANTLGGQLVSFSTPETITAAGITELTQGDFIQAKYISFEVTTASTGAARVLLTVQLTKKQI